MSANLVPNPSAEIDEDADGIPEPWEPYAYYDDVVAEHFWSTEAYSGAKALQVTVYPNPAGVQWHSDGWRQAFINLDDPASPFQRGKTYVMRAWLKTLNCGTKIYAIWWDSGYNVIDSVGSSLIDNPTYQQTEEVVFTIPQEAKYFGFGYRTRLEEIHAGAEYGSAWLDDSEIYEVVPTCTTDAECPPDKPFCVAGVCAECRTEQDCLPGFQCKDGVCVPLPPFPIETIIAIAGPSILGFILALVTTS